MRYTKIFRFIWEENAAIFNTNSELFVAQPQYLCCYRCCRRTSSAYNYFVILNTLNAGSGIVRIKITSHFSHVANQQLQ